MARACHRVWISIALTVLFGLVPAGLAVWFGVPVPWLVVTGAAVGLWAAVRLPGERRHAGGLAETVVAAALVVDATAVLAAWALPLLVLVVVTSRPLGRVLGVVEADVEVSMTGSEGLVAACLAAMTGAELCETWRSSFVRVKSADARDRALEPELRARILEELERRDAAHLRDWLARSPSPACDPVWARTIPGARSDQG